MANDRAVFSSEAMMCLTFTRNLPAGWVAYPETAGFDIVLVRQDDGAQIGVEAKLALNATVIQQIVEPAGHWYAVSPGPDFRAVLVPHGCKGSLSGICRLLGITVIAMMDRASWEAKSYGRRNQPKFYPSLPTVQGNHWANFDGDWVDWAPASRLKLPDYVPDVVPGRSGPVKLTPWKIKAIKMAVLVERRGSVTRADFAALQLDHRRWIEPFTGWLQRAEEKGVYVAGPRLTTFKAQHPKNYAEIAADYEKWAPKQ